MHQTTPLLSIHPLKKLGELSCFFFLWVCNNFHPDLVFHVTSLHKPLSTAHNFRRGENGCREQSKKALKSLYEWNFSDLMQKSSTREQAQQNIKSTIYALTYFSWWSFLQEFLAQTCIFFLSASRNSCRKIKTFSFGVSRRRMMGSFPVPI